MKNTSVLIMLLFILSACQTGVNDNATKEKIYTGETGLELEILDRSLPESVFEDERFDMVLKLTNKGAYPITAGDSILKITTEKDYMEIIEPKGSLPYIYSGSFDLDGKEKFQNTDDFEVKEFKLMSKRLDEQSQIHTVTILATVCYNYVTKAYADICIDTDVYNTKPIEKSCSAEQVSLNGGQGAPVAVTRIEPKMLSDGDSVKPQFVIYLRNTDRGSVIEYERINTICSKESPDRDDYNNVQLTDIRFSGYDRNDFRCEPDIAKLENEEDYIICTLQQGIPRSTPSYKTPLYLEFSYAYTLSEQVQLDIERMFS
ncbi:hypothetical protein JXB41_01345 [Candidatus Woesearchaeota archaeon]|nr:hypothetical protein [Candidatus Woesearchaeota archaeon]